MALHILNKKINYIINDAFCQLAIDDFFEENQTLEQWVWKHIKLYNAITLHPDDLPPIAICNYQGNHYQYILEFHELFKNSLDEIDDPFGK